MLDSGEDLTTTSIYATVLDGNTNAGALATLGTANNNADAFTVKINAGTPCEVPVPRKVTFTLTNLLLKIIGLYHSPKGVVL